VLLQAGIAAVGTGILAIAARFLAASIVALIWAGAALAEKRVALVIGNSHYASEKLKLANPANDAQDLAKALKDIGFDVILRIDMGKGEFDHALADFARKATDADAALFYYAGHGLQSNGQNYFLPVDVEVQDRIDAVDVEYRAIDQGRILNAVDRVDRVRGVKIIILDACRDNPLARQIFYAARSFGGGDKPGLARIDSAEQTFIAYATIHNHVADDGEGRNSPFAAALIKHIKTPGLDIASLFQRVTNEVYKQTGGKQQPEISSSLHTPFYLNPGESDREAWDHVRDSTNPAEFKEFIRKFPDSPFAREAQFRIDLFDRIRSENEEARLDAERRQREADRLREAELKRQEDDRRAREAERKRAEELKRQEDERRAREAELKRQDEERRAREAEFKRQEDDHRVREADRKREEELKRQEDERRLLEAKNKRKEDEARKKAEREREDEQRKIAALEQEEHKKQLEREQQAQICESDQRKLEEFAAGLRAAEIERLAKDTACSSLQPAIAAATKKVAREKKRICEQERRLLAALKDDDIESLKASVGQMKCEAVRAEGKERIAKLELENKRIQFCKDETAKLRAIDDSTPQARSEYAGYMKDSACQSLREEAKMLDKKIESRIKEAQSKLAALGCYKGTVNGRFDDATMNSLALYHSKKGSKETGDHLSDAVLSDLKAQELIVCPGAVIATPIQEPPAATHAKTEEVAPPEHKQPKIEKATHEEKEAPPAVQPKKHRKQVVAHEEEQPAPPPQKPRERHRTHAAAREEAWPPHHRAEPPPPRHHRAESAPKPHRAAKVWQPSGFVGPSASHASPSVIGVGN
jgi:hypothetical protein